MGFIYISTSPSKKSYIGQTIRSIEERFGEHQLPSSGCRAFLGAIQKYGWENFENHWYECPDEDLDKHEELMVEVLGTLAPGGYNLRKGGGSHGKMSEVTIQRMKEAHQGEKHPLFGNGHLVSGEKNPFYGKHHTEETKQILREQKQGEKNSMYGKNHTEEAKQNQREAKLGEKNHKSKTVYQYDLNDNFIRSFGSGGEAARHLDKSAANIRACARGDPKHPSAHGFKWSYTEL